MTTLSPQFDTGNLDLNLKKGESAQFSVAIADYDLDLRGALIFAEIRRLSPGYNLLNNFTGTVSASGNNILVQRYPHAENKADFLNSLNVRIGDLVTLEGSGIVGSKVLAISDSQILVSGTSTRAIGEGRLLVRSLSSASFTAVPYLPIININCSAATIGTTSLTVANITRDIPRGTQLIFNDSGTAKVATLTADLITNTVTASISPLSVAITGNSTCQVGVMVVVMLSTANTGAIALNVSATTLGIPSGTNLNFAVRTGDGWQYIGSATTSTTTLPGVTSIPVASLSNSIPVGAIAWFATHSFNTFYLAIEPNDTQFLESGDYGYDVICRQTNGYTIRVLQGTCKLIDHWSDGV
jgi:hypothetical protein